MTYRLCDFFAQQADFKQGVPTISSSSRRYPLAAHWNNPAAEQPSLERLTGLVGLAHLPRGQTPIAGVSFQIRRLTSPE
jgi:hypothetical protein